MSWLTDLPNSEARTLLSDLRAVRGTSVDILIRRRFEDIAKSAQTVLDNPNSTENQLRFAQGERKVAKCGIIVIEDLLRALATRTKRTRQENNDA